MILSRINSVSKVNPKLIRNETQGNLHLIRQLIKGKNTLWSESRSVEPDQVYPNKHHIYTILKQNHELFQIKSGLRQWGQVIHNKLSPMLSLKNHPQLIIQ